MKPVALRFLLFVLCFATLLSLFACNGEQEQETDEKTNVTETDPKENGIETEPIREDPYNGGRFTFFKDPDGLPLELHE